MVQCRKTSKGFLQFPHVPLAMQVMLPEQSVENIVWLIFLGYSTDDVADFYFTTAQTIRRLWRDFWATGELRKLHPELTDACSLHITRLTTLSKRIF